MGAFYVGNIVTPNASQIWPTFIQDAETLLRRRHLQGWAQVEALAEPVERAKEELLCCRRFLVTSTQSSIVRMRIPSSGSDQFWKGMVQELFVNVFVYK